MFSKKSKYLLASVLIVGFQSQVFAEGSSAELAAGLLAKSQAADNNCHFLNVTDHDELSLLVGRAEIALARKVTIAKTKFIMSHNASIGRSVGCNEAERSEVANVLAAAKAATSRPIEIAKISVAPSKPLAAPRKKQAPVVKVTLTMPIHGLNTYAVLTERYYLARRCGNISRRSMNSLYQSVVSTHNQVLSSFGRNAIAGVMQNSEARANGKSCS
jgi:hypothetical protein